MDKEKYQAFLKEALEKIRKAHKENYLSIFAGAGVSVESKLPSWSDLVGVLKKCLKNTDEDDFLTIAQKFYEEYGNEVYYQRIKELIPDNAEPNKLHDKIVNLNIKNLITTNWDNLFEKAIDNNGAFFHKIKQDNHIRYTTGYSRLVKMHGSLDKNNIVFKKADYEQYSNKFPLIENYVKAIFSTDIVLLIGYSLGDSNVQQILSWLKDCSKQEKFSIYLVKTKDKFSSQDFNDYREEYDIAIFYLEELYPQEERSQRLIKFFEYIEKKSISNNSNSQQKVSSVMLEDEFEFVAEMLHNFDNNKIQEEIDKIEQNTETTNKQELQKAFLLYHSQQYPESYETLKRLSKESFKHRDHKIWYISEFNRKKFPFYIDNTLREKERDTEEKKIEEYLRDARKINLEENYLKLPMDIRENIKPLTTLELDLCKDIIKIYRLKNAINYDYETYKNGGININSNIDELLDILIKVENQRIGFCLLYDYNEFFTNTLESIFVVLATAFLTRDKAIKVNQRNIENQLPEIKIYDMIMPTNLFSYSIRYFKTSKLKEMLEKYCRNDDYFIFQNQESLKVIFANICSLFNYFGVFVTPYSQWFNNFLIISAWINVEQNIFDFILDNFCDKLAQRVVNLNEYQSLDYFLMHQSKNSTIDFKKSIDLLIIYMEKFCREGFGDCDIKAQNCTNLFSKIPQILQKQKQHLIDNKHGKLIQNFIETIPLIALAQTFNYFTMHLYDISEKVLQDKISIVIKEKFEAINDDEKADTNKETCLQFAKMLKEKDILTQQDYDNIQSKIWKEER